MRIGRPETPASNALRRLRGSVSLACAMVAAALLVQVLVWAFAAFTEVRFTTVHETTAAQREPVIVRNNRDLEAPHDSTWSAALDGKTQPGNSNENADVADLPQPAAVNIAFTSADSWLRTLNQLSIALVVVGLVLLAFETSLGVVVAGGTVAPGVGRVTRAQLWSVLLLSLVVPWDRFIPAFPIPPMISNYADMIATTEQFRNQEAGAVSALVFYGRFLILPLAAIAGVNLAGWSFWQGASTAVVSEAPTAYEQAIETEAQDREAGNVRYGGRAGGALQLAMTDERPLARVKDEPLKKKGKPKPEPKPEINIGLMTGTGPLVNPGNINAADDLSLASSTESSAPASPSHAKAAAEIEDDEYRRPI